jgi:hypothetical protein
MVLIRNNLSATHFWITLYEPFYFLELADELKSQGVFSRIFVVHGHNCPGTNIWEKLAFVLSFYVGS